MAEIYLFRHDQSTWNTERRWTGQADPPLTKLGRQQAIKACEIFRGRGFSSVTSSSLKRARETASIISGTLKIELQDTIPDLNERHAGQLTGLTSDEIEVRFPGLMDKWRSGNYIEIPGGESWDDFVTRVRRGLDKLSSLSGRILVAAHEGALRATAYQAGEELRKYENLEGRWVEV